MHFSNLNQQANYGNINSYNEAMNFEKIEERKNKSTKMVGLGISSINKGIDCDDEENDPLGKIFFSTENAKRIQKMIKKEIAARSKCAYILEEDQDESDLLVAMRAVYAEHARFLPDKLVRQVKELNNKVINYIVPDMMTNIKQQYAYIKEINEPLKPIMRPVNVNNAGRRTLPSITTSWGF
jgi:hypothetical protein